ncbi:MAG TPA: murein biosynthesis integral membrane protein MurJ [Candidatus Ornithomonoglobus intestinigallinarum]|uniref:Probable lipid II flippase MurJ n=1 Tax=Candidatus Ornithomonoglobus intestinigallinarum TaxID=2840894 RepID=A0A9D1H5C1_9FIRM|nr:murein biosynthesis integral membrane protein MurJ [Candidatus Ornithomonoglobus intestinigallinarum]
MSRETGKGLLKTAVFMAFATLLSKVLGLIRDALIAAFFGTGLEADAFMTASKAPTTLFDIVIGGVISATFIPVFSDVLARRGKKDAMEFMNKFVTMVFIATVLISAFGMIFADPLVNLLAPNYTGDKFDLTVRLTFIMFPMIIFTGFAFSFVGFLQSMGEYNIPSIISLVSNAAIIIYFALFGKKFGVVGLAVTMVVAWSLQVAVQVPSLLKFKYKFRLDFRLKDKNILNALKLAGPMLISTWVQPLYSIVNLRLASGIDGAYSSLEYANRLYIVVTGVFSFVVTNLIFPKLAKANVSDSGEDAQTLITVSLRATALVILPLTAGIMLLSAPITKIIYQSGEMTSSGASVIAGALSCYSVGMVGLAVNEILSKYFFSINDSKTPMRNSILSMVFNIILAYVLFGIFKTYGLALAAAGGSIFNAFLNGVCIIRRRPGMIKRADGAVFVKALIAAVIMAAAVFGVYSLVYDADAGRLGQIITCAVCGVSGVIVYAVCVLLLKVDEVRALIKRK